jgi:signal transduction histidine kinase
MVTLSHFIHRSIESPQLSFLSRPDYKRVRITAYLSLVCIIIAVMYGITDLSNKVYYSAPAYGILLVSSITVLLLLRRGLYVPAKVLLMVTVNLVVFYASVTDPFETGAFLLYIPGGVASFAVLGFKDQMKSYYLILFTATLFFVSYFGDIHIGNTAPSQEYVVISFIINFVISMTATILVLYFLVELNSESERELIAKEKTVSEKNQELTKVNQELDRFVYSVSHDLRSPLSSILGITNLAKHAESKEQLVEYMKLIEGRIKAQDIFIREIIDYSRNVRTRVEKEEIVVADLIHEIIESLRYQAGAEGIHFHVEDDEYQTRIAVDKTRLRIILSNLINNSIKYQDVRKDHRTITIGIRSSRHEHSVSVRDNGIGIATEHVPKVFDMFYRASENSSGSGLGLFITQEAVEKIGGTIAVESKIGEGTTFTVKFPS